MRVYTHEECPQGSESWFELHKGIPTASEAFKVMAKRGPRGGESHKEYVQRATYMRVIAAEIVTGELREVEWFGNRHTERGKAREDEARLRYGLEYDCEPIRVGFVMADGFGCSPDSFRETDGGVEIKDVLAHRQIERLTAGVLPPEHKWQVLGCLLACEDRAYWDFVSHSRGLPLFVIRVTREQYRTDLELLAGALDEFREETLKLVAWINSMR